MPTYQNCNLILNLTYVTTQPEAAAVYTDTNGSTFTIWYRSGSSYYVVGNNAPALGTLTKVSGTGDSTITLNSFAANPVVVAGQTRIEPGQAITTTEFLYNLPVGVIQTSSLPVFSPVLYSVAISSSQTITLPMTITGYYNVTIFAKTGEVAVKFNDASSTTLYIPEGTVYSVGCSTRIVDNIIFTIASGGLAYLTIDTV